MVSVRMAFISPVLVDGEEELEDLFYVIKFKKYFANGTFRVSSYRMSYTYDPYDLLKIMKNKNPENISYKAVSNVLKIKNNLYPVSLYPFQQNPSLMQNLSNVSVVSNNDGVYVAFPFSKIIDSIHIKDGNYIPFIPGSTIKGAIRAGMEYYLANRKGWDLENNMSKIDNLMKALSVSDFYPSSKDVPVLGLYNYNPYGKSSENKSNTFAEAIRSDGRVYFEGSISINRVPESLRLWSKYLEIDMDDEEGAISEILSMAESHIKDVYELVSKKIYVNKNNNYVSDFVKYLNQSFAESTTYVMRIGKHVGACYHIVENYPARSYRYEDKMNNIKRKYCFQKNTEPFVYIYETDVKRRLPFGWVKLSVVGE